MKKFVLVLIVMVMVSACNQVVDLPKPHDDEFIYDNQGHIDYGLTQASLLDFRMIKPSPEGLYYLAYVRTRPNSDENPGMVLGFYNFKSKKASIVNANVSETCSYEDASQCSSFFSSSASGLPRFLRYYKEKLYYVIESLGQNTELNKTFLYQMDLDGNNRKLVLELPEASINHPPKYAFSDSYTSMFLLHQDHLYYTYGSNGIFKINLSDFTIENVGERFKDSAIQMINFVDDQMYVFLSYYKDEDKKVESEVLFKSDLKGDNLEHLGSASPAFIMTDQGFYTTLINDEDGYDMTYLSFDGQAEQLIDGIGSIYQTKVGYLINGMRLDNQEGANFKLLDKNNELITSKVFDTRYGIISFQGVVGDYYYGLMMDDEEDNANMHLIRIGLYNNQIGEIELLDQWENFVYSR